jgi:transketolase
MLNDQRRNFPAEELTRAATNIRKHLIRMVARHGQGYVQQGLGATDLFTYLYFAELQLDPVDAFRKDRDRFFLSTAHNSAVFHATLAERGLIDVSRLDTYCDDGSELEINVSERLGPLVECTCGSLGQGLSVAIGHAESARRRGKKNRFHVVLGDGELQEGQTWEAALYAGSRVIDSLCLTIDLNKLQVQGDTSTVLAMAPIADKWTSFGWAVRSVDGNDFSDLAAGYDWLRTQGKPGVLIANTLVGKGVPFLEGKMSHNMVLPSAVADKALDYLEKAPVVDSSQGSAL